MCIIKNVGYLHYLLNVYFLEYEELSRDELRNFPGAAVVRAKDPHNEQNISLLDF